MDAEIDAVFQEMQRAGVPQVEEQDEKAERECDGCSVVFTPTRRGQRFHSKACGDRARRLGL